MVQSSLLLLMITFSNLTFADRNLDSLVNEYWAKKSTLTFQQRNAEAFRLLKITPLSSMEHRRCDDSDEGVRSACIDRACEYVGAWGCDSVDEIKQISEACRGNYNTQCLEAACERVGAFGCDSVAELKVIGTGCRGNLNSKCLSAACRYVGAFGCDSPDEVAKIAAGCFGNRDSECMDAVCRRVGLFGCDSVDEIHEVAKACSEFRH